MPDDINRSLEAPCPSTAQQAVLKNDAEMTNQSASLPATPKVADFQFRRSDWIPFRSISTLPQVAGVPIAQMRRLVLKELTDNALDAGARVELGQLDERGDRYFVQDDGPGIAPEDVADLFSLNRPLTSSKLWRMPTRGAMGNGLRVVVGAVAASDGRLEVLTRNQRLILTPQEDGSTAVEAFEIDFPDGARIEITFGRTLPVDRDALSWAEAAVRMAEGGKTYGGKPSPHWYDADHFFEMLQAVNDKPVRELIAELDGCSGKAGQIAAAFKGMSCNALNKDQAITLLRAARLQAKPVRPDRLGCVGPMPFLPPHYAIERGTFRSGGREQPRVDAVETQARALFADDPDPLILTGELMEMTRGYRMRDGSAVSGKVMVHPDPRVQAVLEQVRERETAQAIDRLRLIHCPGPKRVIVLSNLVLDLTVDRLVTWREIMPSRFEQAAARGPAVPLSASEMARCFPDLWLSVEAAKHELRRTEDVTYGSESLDGKSDLNRAKPHIEEFLYGKWPYLNRRTHIKVFYRRLGQKGRASPAAVRADAPNPRAALESVVGPVVWFKIEQETEPAAAAQAETPVEAEPVNTPVSQIDAEPAGDLDLRIVDAFADRLAELSARLEAARPPSRWGDLSDVSRERAWRARMSALHEMPMAAGGRR